ncbi:MAG: hypothetical protein SGBAC_011817 [Bacillariaceae sp.]
METHIAILLRENAATTFVIVRDDAVIPIERRREFRDPELSDDEDWNRPSSFKNTPAVNSAPTIPARKESNDSLFSISTTYEADKDVPPKNGLKNGFFDRFRGFRKRTMSFKRKKKARVRKASSKTCDGREEHYAASETNENSTQTAENNTERSSRDCIPSLSPMNRTYESVEDNSPPTLPLRKKSDDNLTDHAVECTRPFHRRSSLEDTRELLLPDCQPNPISERRGSLESAVDSTELLSPERKTRKHFQRRKSLDNSIFLTSAKSKNCVHRRGSLDNSIFISDEQTKRHFERRGSMDNALLSSDEQTRQRFERRSSLDNAAMLVDQKTKLQQQRRGSLDNTLLPSSDHSHQSFQRRGSLDLTMMPIINPNRRSQPSQRRSSMDNAMTSSNNQAQLRFQRQSSIDSTMVRPTDQEPLHRLSRRSSLDCIALSSNTPYSQACQRQNCERNEVDVTMAASVLSNVPGAPASDCDLKQRILSKLNSPRWQENVQISSDIFQISRFNDEYADGNELQSQLQASSLVPPCRMISDDQLSCLSHEPGRT